MFLPMAAGGMEDRSPYGDFWFEPVTVQSSSGMRVSSDQAMRLAAVYACVNLLAKTFAIAPFKLYKPRAGTDGGRDEQRNHWLYLLIARRPNRFQDPFMWRRMLMGHLSLRGNAYNRIYTDGRGVITDLVPQHPDCISAELLPEKSGAGNGEWRYRIRHRDGSDEIVPRGEIWHLRGLSADGIMGLNPIEYARETVGIGLAAQEYGARFFANDARPGGGWLSFAGRFKDDEAKKLFADKWQQSQSGGNRHRTPVLENGMEYHEVAIKNNDAQFLESRQFSVTDVCRIFGVPPHLVADLERSTNNNIEQQSLEYLLYTMAPIAGAWQSSIAYDLSDDDDLEPEFDLMQLTRADQTTRGNFNAKMFGVGAFSVNDIIVREGGNPVAGGDQRFIPVNMQPLKPDMPTPSAQNPLGGANPKDGETDSADEPTPPKPPAKPGKSGAEAARLFSIAAATVDRCVRKELEALRKAAKTSSVAAFYERHAEFIAGALAIPPLDAVDYCCTQTERYLTALSESTTNVDELMVLIEQSARASLTRLAVGN